MSFFNFSIGSAFAYKNQTLSAKHKILIQYLNHKLLRAIEQKNFVPYMEYDEVTGIVLLERQNKNGFHVNRHDPIIRAINGEKITKTFDLKSFIEHFHEAIRLEITIDWQGRSEILVYEWGKLKI